MLSWNQTIKWVLTSLVKDKLHHFIILKDNKGVYRPFKMGDEMHATTANQEVINDYCRKLNRWMSPARFPGDVDYIKHLFWQTTIEQLMSFEPLDTKKYDCAVSLGWWRIGIDALVEWYAKALEEDEGYDKEGFDAAISELLLM
jgi:hypothetical protein